MNEKEFIAKLAPYAVADMHNTGVSAALTIAQGILESAHGNSGLTVKANNLFGIKGRGDAGTVSMPTTEYVKGKAVRVTARFAKYSDWGASIAAHSALILRGVSWDRNLYKPVIGKRGAAAARAIADCGYATDPKYAEKLISLMNTYDLYRYDDSKKPVKELPKMKAEDANTIINRWMKKAYADAKTPDERKEIGRLADELRVASGQPKQNG